MLDEHNKSNLFCIGVSNTTNCNIYSHVIVMSVPATNMPLKCQIYAQIQVSLCPHKLVYVHISLCTQSCVSINAIYEITANNNVARSTGIHKFHITGICSMKYIPVTFTYISNCTTTIYIDCTYMHNNKL